MPSCDALDMRSSTSPGTSWRTIQSRSFGGSGQPSPDRPGWARCGGSNKGLRLAGCRPAVARAENGDRFEITGGGPDVILGPLARLGVAGFGGDPIAGLVEVELGDTQLDAWPEQRPVRTRAAIRHADAAGIYHEAAVCEAAEWHVGVAAEDRK